MIDEKSALLEQADRCRRQAQAINVDDVAARLTAMAQGYEEQAARLAASSRPSVLLVLLGDLARLTRQVPIHSLAMAFLVGLIVAQRR
jgi:hypothetical protein